MPETDPKVFRAQKNIMVTLDNENEASSKRPKVAPISVVSESILAA